MMKRIISGGVTGDLYPVPLECVCVYFSLSNPSEPGGERGFNWGPFSGRGVRIPGMDVSSIIWHMAGTFLRSSDHYLIFHERTNN